MDVKRGADVVSSWSLCMFAMSISMPSSRRIVRRVNWSVQMPAFQSVGSQYGGGIKHEGPSGRPRECLLDQLGFVVGIEVEVMVEVENHDLFRMALCELPRLRRNLVERSILQRP